MIKTAFAVSALALAATSANAIALDGTIDAEYGAAKSHVSYNASAPNSNFGSPTNESDNVAYDIYLYSDASAVYGIIKALGSTGGLDFANLYWDLDPANANGSDLGFEITNDRAFIPGVGGYAESLAGLDFFVGAGVVEFSIENSLLTGAIPGLSYYGGHTLPSVGDDIVLRLSQSMGYSVAGGASYGADRLGRVTIGGAAEGAVPEPASWALMIGGLGVVGMSMRRRKPVASFV